MSTDTQPQGKGRRRKGEMKPERKERRPRSRPEREGAGPRKERCKNQEKHQHPKQAGKRTPDHEGGAAAAPAHQGDGSRRPEGQRGARKRGGEEKMTIIAARNPPAALARS